MLTTFSWKQNNKSYIFFILKPAYEMLWISHCYTIPFKKCIRIFLKTLQLLILQKSSTVIMTPKTKVLGNVIQWLVSTVAGWSSPMVATFVQLLARMATNPTSGAQCIQAGTIAVQHTW